METFRSVDTRTVDTARGTHPHGACPLCALPRTPQDVAGLAWSTQHELDGSVTFICPTCTRAQLWRIEAMLAVASPTAPAAPTRLRPAA